jgi:RNA polymerase sigma-70 factor (ECF subfamily)
LIFQLFDLPSAHQLTPHTAVNENEIWKNLQAGDYSALKELYHSHFKLLYAYGYKISGDHARTEDAIQDLFVDLWKYKANLATTTNIRFYLFRSLRRALHKNVLKSKKALDNFDQLNYQEVQNAPLSAENSIISEEESNDWKNRLEARLEVLSDRQRIAINLKFYKDKSYSEIGKYLGINEQSARNLVRRTLNMLKKDLQTYTLISLVTLVFSLPY